MTDVNGIAALSATIPTAHIEGYVTATATSADRRRGRESHNANTPKLALHRFGSADFWSQPCFLDYAS